MVGHMIKMVYQEVRGLHQAAYILAIFAFGSQLLALVRDRLLANEFGAGIELDLYYTAFRIPDLMYVLFASTLSVYVLIPFVAERISETDSSKAKQLLSQIFSLFLVVYTLIAAVIFFLAPTLVPILFPGFAAEADILTTLLRILLLQPLFLGISSLFGVITQMEHRFVLYALSPLLYNIGIIAGILFLFPVFGLSGLVYGVVLGAAAHALVQVPFVITSPLAPRSTFIFDWSEIRSVLATSIPRAFTLSLTQLTLLVLISIASVMTVGSVAVFQLAYNLQSVPLAIVGVSYSVAAFPILAQLFSDDNLEQFRTHIITALRHIIFWTVPMVALIIVIRAQLVRVILGSGEFDWDDTMLTAAMLVMFVISLVAQAINLLLVRSLYAGGDTRTPLTIAVLGSVSAIVFSYTLYQIFVTYPAFATQVESVMRVSSAVGTEVLMLGLGFTIAVIMQTIALFVAAVRRYQLPTDWLYRHFARAILAAVLGGSVAYVTLNLIVSGLKTDTVIGIFLHGLVAGGTGIVTVALVYYLLRTPEFFEVIASVKKRWLKSSAV